MQLKNVLQNGIEILERARIAPPRLTAEVLLMCALNCNRTQLLAHPERELNDAERGCFDEYLQERLKGKPTQYITGHQEFWGLDFVVEPSVLIPRPETELVVETALAIARREFSEEQDLKIADVGTGSGCIAIALANELPNASVCATDFSVNALEVAQLNGLRHGVIHRLRFLNLDLLPAPVSDGDRFHIIVSNPPYVAESERDKLEREVRDYEPHEALFAGQAGADVYEKLIPLAAQSLISGGWLVLELGYDSEGRIRECLVPELWEHIEWRRDLAGIVRVVAARRTH